MKKLFATVSLVLMLVLSACGGSTPKTNVFVDQNALTGGIPSDAEQVSKEEFQRAIDAGENVVVSDATLKAQKAARDKQFQDDKSFLNSLTDKPAYVQQLLDESANTPSFDGDQPVTQPNGDTVVLYGLGNQLRQATEIAQRGQSVENALSDYGLSYDLLSDTLKSQLPTPESLKGKSLSEIQTALAQLNALLATPAGSTGIRPARLETGGPRVSTQAINAGNGMDSNGPCTPTNLYAKYWFPLKNFISPIKDQAKRGTCWAFTAIGAIESRERVQNNNPVNLSEQFLVNKVKQDWDSNDYSDGYWSEKALETAVDKGQSFPSEAAWTYNRATSRPSVKDGDSASYANTCNGYTGTCSDTAHESRRTCTTFIFTFCSYVKVTFGGPGVGSSRTTQIWKNGDTFDLNRYRLYLSQGYTIMASFPVYRGFMDDVKSDGIVSVYSKTKFDDKGKEVNGSYGGHAVQIVGFLSNDEMSTFNNQVNIGGGGYFIIKNSWGCVADGGFYYIPADYVSSIFNSLSVLNFDSRRSDAWNKEQAAPGGSEAPKIQLKSVSPINLRVETNLAQFFNITHPVAKSINLTVTSSADGQLYNGSWSTDTNSLFGSELKRTFGSVGSRTITLLAKYGQSQATASFNINVVNTPPTLTPQYAGTARQTVAYPMSAIISDINENNAAALCANTTWAVDAPDTLNTTTGCQVQVTFGAIGSRQVRVSTHDTEGAVTNQTVTLPVAEPPANPYPKITSYGVYSRQFTGSGNFRFCGSPAVANGGTIDFAQTGCTFLIGQPIPRRYFAEIVVENPTNETITYDWKTYVTYNSSDHLINDVPGSSSNIFEPYSPGNAGLGTDDCHITVKVNAPEASRSKGPITVWTGRCTYYSFRLN